MLHKMSYKINIILLLLPVVCFFPYCANSSNNITGSVINQDSIDNNTQDSNTQDSNSSDNISGYVSIDCIHTGSGKDYQVGPGKEYATIGDVPWMDLAAGDTVRIFWKEEPYREKILIRGKGTADQPIRVCGVANDAGQMPVLSGENASTAATLDYGSYAPMQALGLVMIYDREWTERPEYITIEGLALKSAHPAYTSTNTSGNTVTYENGAACVWVQEGKYITIRGNAITDCGNGIFVMSKSDKRRTSAN